MALLELAPEVVVGDRFRLVRPLGKGGMGTVWEAVHIALETPCALKFIHEDAATSAELRVRFEREAKAAALLRSPHVVNVLDHGVWAGRPYIAMELLEGEDLARRLRRRRPLPAREVVSIATQVGRALAKAHAAGLIHRDLKPSNIFLVPYDDGEIAKVLDFGVAKMSSLTHGGDQEAHTRSGDVLGTPVYMSPEQARGSRNIDHRADLWALSVVVYQCMTGKLPFRGEGFGDLLVKIIVEPAPVPSTVAEVPPLFDEWWRKATDRDIAQRFQTARDLTDALAAALEVSATGPVDASGKVDAPRTPRGATGEAPRVEPEVEGSADVGLGLAPLRERTTRSEEARGPRSGPRGGELEGPSPRSGTGADPGAGPGAIGEIPEPATAGPSVADPRDREGSRPARAVGTRAAMVLAIGALSVLVMGVVGTLRKSPVTPAAPVAAAAAPAAATSSASPDPTARASATVPGETPPRAGDPPRASASSAAPSRPRQGGRRAPPVKPPASGVPRGPARPAAPSSAPEDEFGI